MQDVELILGEKRLDRQNSARVYFFWITNTGMSKPLRECPTMRARGTRTNEVGDDRETFVAYEVDANTVVKMFVGVSRNGSPISNVNLYLKVSDDAARIAITGPNGFGSFTGRASIDYERSNITKDELANVVKVKTLSAPKNSAAGRGVRSLLISKGGK